MNAVSEDVEIDTEEELRAASSLARAELQKLSRPGESLTLLVSQNKEEHELRLPAEAVRLLMDVLEHLAVHRHVSVVASDYQLTTQQVADILRVSRPYVTKLIDTGALPCQMVGTHRRVRYDDLSAYKDRVDRERRAVLDDLTRQSQELGLEY